MIQTRKRKARPTHVGWAPRAHASLRIPTARTWIRAVAATLALCTAANAVNAAQVPIHDPVLAKQATQYYLFATGPGITFYSSTDLLNWQPEARIFPTQPAWAKAVAPGFDGTIWAPDIQFHQGRYLLYYAVSSFGKNASAIGVTTSPTLDPRAPDYRWTDQGMLLQSVPGRDLWNAIDPNVIEDDAGTVWLSFGSFWSGIKLAKLDPTWTKLADPQEWHTLVRRERAAFTADQNAGPAEVEAPFIFKKNGWYYLFFSEGLCCKGASSTYHVMIGRSKLVTGPYRDREGRDLAQGGGSLLIDGDKDWQALGHNGAYSFDGKDWLVLHAYETADRYKSKLKLLELRWDADAWPIVDRADLNNYMSKRLP